MGDGQKTLLENCPLCMIGVIEKSDPRRSNTRTVFVAPKKSNNHQEKWELFPTERKETNEANWERTARVPYKHTGQ